MTDPVGIIATGVANLASIRAAFGRLGAETREITLPRDIIGAKHIVLPGVGAFGAAMTQLDSLQLADALRARIADRRPTLAICLGMQLLFARSEETPGANGLGIFSLPVTRLNAVNFPIPQMGWNEVAPQNGFTANQSGAAYFANSYGIEMQNISGWKTAGYTYGSEYIAALESGGVLACQFHPELSGAWGQSLLQNWMAATC